MAVLRSGILGNIRGKVAGVVGSQWKDRNYVREYVKPANPNTAAQQVQRTAMSDVVDFCKSLVGPIFNAYTDKFQKSMSGFNFFIKRNIAEFDGSPIMANIKLTEGKLFALQSLDSEYDTALTKCSITWDEAVGNNGSLTDKVYGAVYDDNTKLWYFASAEATRDDELIEVTVPAGLSNLDLQSFAFAAKYAGTLVDIISDSNWSNNSVA